MPFQGERAHLAACPFPFWPARVYGLPEILEMLPSEIPLLISFESSWTQKQKTKQWQNAKNRFLEATVLSSQKEIFKTLGEGRSWEGDFTPCILEREPIFSLKKSLYCIHIACVCVMCLYTYYVSPTEISQGFLLGFILLETIPTQSHWAFLFAFSCQRPGWIHTPFSPHCPSDVFVPFTFPFPEESEGNSSGLLALLQSQKLLCC